MTYIVILMSFQTFSSLNYALTNATRCFKQMFYSRIRVNTVQKIFYNFVQT